jgi:hypothetical protein
MSLLIFIIILSKIVMVDKYSNKEEKEDFFLEILA